jgi:hypothetical protein
MPIQVYCDNSIDPPKVVIIIADQLPFSVSLAVYELLKGPLGLPDNPCNV